MKKFYVEFETMEGDELDESDLKSATWRVREMYVDIDEQDEPVLTMRIEVHSLDMLTPNISPQQVYDWTKEDSGVRDDDPDPHGVSDDEEDGRREDPWPQ